MNRFIGIREVGPTDCRVSILQDDGSKLTVVGNLSHGYSFEPSTIKEAKKLIDWLEGWINQKERTT